MDPYNIDGYYKGANYGNSNFNVGNRVVAYALINSPTVNAPNRLLKALANDWSFNPVFQGQNGLPTRRPSALDTPRIRRRTQAGTVRATITGSPSSGAIPSISPARSSWICVSKSNSTFQCRTSRITCN